ncbi:MAG: hypothetical protein J0I12_04180 [Candidatus Eremiobacteraeota bacterium]|nr:hypothetical protein [Candidatus Eremiobacteraeota bacterium]
MKASAPSEATEPTESVTLSGRPSAPVVEKADTGKLAQQGSGVLGKVFGGLGLGLMALSLAGCNFGGGTPTPTPPNNEKPQESTAATYTARMDQLRGQSDKKGYYQMAEAGYNNAVLQKFAQATDPAAKDVAELAKKAVETFNFKGDPAEQQKLTRDVLKAIAEMKGDDSGLVRYTQAAQTTLAIDQAFADGAAAAPGGIVAQLKNSAYEQGFKAALEKIQAAPDQLKNQSGYDPALIRNYVESVSINPQIALDFAPQLNDQGLTAVLYQTTGNALYQRVSTDGGVLGTQVQTALQLLKTLSGK